MSRREIITLYGPVEKVWHCDLMERPVEQLRTRLIRPKEDVRLPYTHVYTYVAAHAVETLLIEFKDET